jgi:hypothetical protein
MKNTVERIEELCNSYNIQVFDNVRDNVMSLVESGMVSDEEKLEAMDLYDEYLIEANKLDILCEYVDKLRMVMTDNEIQVLLQKIQLIQKIF